MIVDNKPLVLDLIEWVAARPRQYSEVMDAWRTSCPRLPIWEDAIDLGFVVCRESDGTLMVAITPIGREFLHMERQRYLADGARSLEASP